MPKSQPHQPLVDFLVRKLSEVGPMSREDLCRLAIHEGYFADGDSAQEKMHAMFMSVVKAGQLPNARFAPAVVTDTMRLRQAI
jgi:hypothetical protein